MRTLAGVRKASGRAEGQVAHQALRKQGSETEGRRQRQQGRTWGTPSSSSLRNKDKK